MARRRTLPSCLEVLPRNSTMDEISAKMRGPTETSNWVMKDALMAGAQPNIVEDITWSGKIRWRTEEELKSEMDLIKCDADGVVNLKESSFKIKDFPSARWLNKELAKGQLNWNEYEDPTFVARIGDRVAWNVMIGKEEEKDTMTLLIHRPGDLKRILWAGIDVFVCLQSELSSRPLPYEEEANEWYRENHALQRSNAYFDNGSEENQEMIQSLEFHHFPTRDGTTFGDETLIHMVDQISKLIQTGRKIYVHCRGGHGQTGVFVACLLGALFPRMGEKEVLERVQKYHDCRIRPQGELMSTPLSPQTREQVAQVKRYLRKRRPGFFNFISCRSNKQKMAAILLQRRATKNKMLSQKRQLMTSSKMSLQFIGNSRRGRDCEGRKSTARRT